MSSKSNTYNLLPYQSTILQSAGIEHLSLCLLWHGFENTFDEEISCIELGCGNAANLISLAYYHSNATFIGIDNSESELNIGKNAIDILQLKNTQLIHNDIRDLDPASLLPSNYIITHGLYSWVSEDTRDAVLAFCSKNLKQNGLAYISYNAQPGWAMRKLVRDTLLRCKAAQDAPLEKKAAAAQTYARQLLEDLPSQTYAHAVLLSEELERVRDSSSGYVYHEYLTEHNEGFWLSDFVNRTNRHKLEYVCDAQFCRWEGHIPPDLKNALEKRNLDRVELEERADLLGDRYFRASILCSTDAARSTQSHHELLQKVHIATGLSAKSDPFDLTEGVVEKFDGQGLTIKNIPKVTLDGAITKAAVLVLSAQWPKGLHLEDLYQQAAQMVEKHNSEILPDARECLANELITLFESGQVDFRLHEPQFSSTVPEYPKVHALALFEAWNRQALTTPYHIPIPFEKRITEMVQCLDGTRTITELGKTFDGKLVEETNRILARWGLL